MALNHTHTFVTMVKINANTIIHENPQVNRNEKLIYIKVKILITIVSDGIHDVLKNGGLHKTVKPTIFNKIPLLQFVLCSYIVFE